MDGEIAIRIAVHRVRRVTMEEVKPYNICIDLWQGQKLTFIMYYFYIDYFK